MSKISKSQRRLMGPTVRVPRFKEGRRYRCMDGSYVTVMRCKNDHRGYESVECSDKSEHGPHGVHRYNRSTHSSDTGRVTGSAHDFSDPRNLDPRQIGLPLRQR